VTFVAKWLPKNGSPLSPFFGLLLLCGSWFYELFGILSDDVAAGFFICRRTSFSGFRKKFNKMKNSQTKKEKNGKPIERAISTSSCRGCHLGTAAVDDLHGYRSTATAYAAALQRSSLLHSENTGTFKIKISNYITY